MLDLQGFGQLLLSGTWVTIKLALTSLVIGLILGLLGATAKMSRFKVLNAIATAYTTIIRGIPELLLVMFIYFGGSMLMGFILSQFGNTGYVDVSPFWAGVTALSVAFGAYATEIFRMAFQEIPKGQVEAAQAIGMSYSQKLRRIIFPRAFGIMLPAYGNEVIFMLKGSALASTITLMDITGVATTIMSKTYTVFELFFAAGIIYLLLSWLLIGMFRLAEKRINRHLSYQPVSNGSVTA